MSTGAEKKTENQDVMRPPDENVRTEYSEVCQNHRAVADFRSKLLTLLPVISGVGIYVLLPKDKPPVDLGSSYLIAIGIFGVLVTLGLFLHELRAIAECGDLIRVGRQLEVAMGFTDGQFIREDLYYHQGEPWAKRIRNFKGPVGAARIIYPSVGIAWLFVAVLGLFGPQSKASPFADGPAIEKLHQQDVAATLAGDPKDLADLFTDDAVLLEPGAPAIIGKKAILAKNEKDRAEHPSSKVLTYYPKIQDLQIVNGWALEWAYFDSSFKESENGAAKSFRGKALRVLKREPRGNWKFARVMWNPAE